MRRRRRAGGCFARLFFAALLIALASAGALIFLLTQPYQGFQNSVFLEIPKGTSTSGIAGELARQGVIRYPWLFLLARALRPDARLQAGEYLFKQPAGVWPVFDRIVRGDVFYYEVTVPEGSNIFDIAQIVGQLGFISGPDFAKTARNPALIRDLAPEAPSLEGYLFPSTYRLTRASTAQQLCRAMTDLFRKKWRELEPLPGPAAVHDAVTLASLIEKETAVAAERPIVASVYRNRLRQHIALDCDPTTIYAALLENRYRGAIHKSDLANPNAYNTYRHAGLPPGPIANPGTASLRAALQPADTQYLYFVAKPDGSGGHRFSTNLHEHDIAVQQYRRGAR